MSVKDHVSDGKKVRFVRFSGIDNELIYVTELGFEFPVPLADTVGAVFLAEDKALLFMRWISRHMKFLDGAKRLRVA